MNLRVSADHAGWTIREAAWGFEERILWRGNDATRDAVDRASRAVEPLQRLVQTRLTWPLSDALRARSGRTRTMIAASAAAVALGAATAGVMTAPIGHPGAHHAATAAAPLVAAVPQSSNTLVLQGVTPHFEPGHAAVPTQPPAKPSAAPAQVAWQFAQAFVGYEVGHSSKATDAAFAGTATRQLAKALSADPPRLPATGKVPKARVVNVVLGDGSKQQVTASVSLVRLRAISEIRLTLTKTGDVWRVAQVLG
jgi:hypothetical protein